MKKNVVSTCLHVQDVEQILVGSDGAAKGVVLKDGTEIHSKVVLSNATPYVTFRRLMPQVWQRNRKQNAVLSQLSVCVDVVILLSF